MIVKSRLLPRGGMTWCGIQSVLAKDKVNESFEILYVTTRKGSSEMEIKKTTGKNKISGTMNTVKIRKKVKTVLKDYER
jgi:hypothetical protein